MSGRHRSSPRPHTPHAESPISGIQDLTDLAYYVKPEAAQDAANGHVLAARRIVQGALRDSYDIPDVTFSRNEGRGLLLTTMLIAGWVSWHLGYQSLVLLACTAPATVFRAIGFVLSWFDRPVEATPSGKSG